MENIINEIKLRQERIEQLEKRLADALTRSEKHRYQMEYEQQEMEIYNRAVMTIEKKLANIEEETKKEIFKYVVDEIIKQFLLHLDVSKWYQNQWQVFGVITPNDKTRSFLKDSRNKTPEIMNDILDILLPLVTQFGETIYFDYRVDSAGWYCETKVSCNGFDTISLHDRHRKKGSDFFFTQDRGTI